MTSRSLVALGSAVLLMPAAGGCAAAPPLRIDHGRVPTVSSLSDLHLPQGTDVIVVVTRGEHVRGVLRDVRPGELQLMVPIEYSDPALRAIPESDIQTIARVVGRSKRARTRLGAVIGAAATLPFSISIFADMIVPGAIAGALIGRGTGDSRGEIVFARTPATVRRNLQ
jgi:hypothetical protein